LLEDSEDASAMKMREEEREDGGVRDRGKGGAVVSCEDI
jgi:hypothetical protein